MNIDNINWEQLNTTLFKATLGEGPIVNNKLKKYKLIGSNIQKANYLYDWADTYLDEKKYRAAEICLLEIEKLNCWNNDVTLKPGTYSLMASCYFNMAIKKYAGRQYRSSQFDKAQKYANRACKCVLPNLDLEKRTKTGAWQVLFCISVLCKDVFTAAKLRAKYNIYFMTYRISNPFEPSNNWYVCSEIDAQFIENEFVKLLQKKIFENPNSFDDFYELHSQNKSSFNYTESLAFAATFVENNTNKIAILYEHLFQYINLNNTDFENYFFNLCEKLSAIVFSNDNSEIRRTLKELDNLKNEHKSSYDKINPYFKQEYIALKLYSLIQLYEYDEAIKYANTLPQSECTEQVLYCVAKAKEQLGDFENAERAIMASLSIEADAFKIHGLGRLYYAQQEYEKAYTMFKWALEGVKKDIRKGVKIEGPKNLPSLGRPSTCVLRDLYTDLIDTLLMMNDFDEAKNIYHAYSELPNATEKNTILLKINRMQKLYESKKESDKENDVIKLELIRKNKTIQDMIEFQKNWYEDLLKCQILDMDIEVTDEVWDNLDIDNKMEKIIKKINGLMSVYSSSKYEDVLSNVKERYPRLSVQSQKYLTSAEQIFEVFLKNPLIDCAPALVEFVRVYEESLWHYIDNTSHYSAIASKQLRTHPKTLGTAGYIIRNYNGPLKKYSDEIRKITNMRNESAHAYVSKEPEIAAIRKMIWGNKPTLLDVLTAI